MEPGGAPEGNVSEPVRRCCGGRLPPALEAELLGLIGKCRWLEAIRRLREAMGLPVLACKEWVVEHAPSKPNPCPYCGKPLRTERASQCFECGADWHDADPAATPDAGG
jgi:hypothetical protein